MRGETGATRDARAGALGLRVLVTVAEEHLAGEPSSAAGSVRQVAVAAVVANPLAGRYEEDLAERLLKLADRSRVVAIGRAALAGQDGELEHAAALVGPGFAASLRADLGPWRATTPSTKKLGAPGAIAAVTLDYLQGASGPALPPVEVRVAGRPRDDEALIVLAAVESAEPRPGNAQA